MGSFCSAVCDSGLTSWFQAFAVTKCNLCRYVEEEIAAFIRHRNSSDALLAAPSKSWVGAGKHIWYNEAEGLGRGSLGTVGRCTS